MPKYRGIGGLLALAAAFGPATASADTIGPPQVYVRQIDSIGGAIGTWLPLSATVSNMGPWEIGIKVQPQPSAPDNRQAVEVDHTSSMGSVPENPFAPVCQNIVGSADSIWGLGGGGTMYYTGNGAYEMKVSAYTDAQHNTFPGNTCNGGPTSDVTLSVDARTVAAIAGTPLAPRITRKAHGFAGLRFTVPAGDVGDEWRCALNPVFRSDGSVTGAVTTHDRSNQSSSDPSKPAEIEVDEKTAFTRPGRWACAARGLGGNDVFAQDLSPTPWARTHTVTVKGQYERSNSRLAFAPHGRMTLAIFTPKLLRPFAAGGHLTLKIGKAVCVGRAGRFKLKTVVSTHARLSSAGIAVFHFRPPATQVFYLGRLTFGGTSLLIAGSDAPIYLQVTQPPDPRKKPVLHFVPPTAWAPCS